MTNKLSCIVSSAHLRSASCALGLVLAFGVAGCSTAPLEQPAIEWRLTERYPPGTIRTVEIADQAKADVENARAQIEARFSAKERNCYERFFTTSCLDAAKEERRQGLVEARAVEVEANALQRRAKVERRDRALAERQVKDKAREQE